jgi:hypothetical protein
MHRIKAVAELLVRDTIAVSAVTESLWRCTGGR